MSRKVGQTDLACVVVAGHFLNRKVFLTDLAGGVAVAGHFFNRNVDVSYVEVAGVDWGWPWIFLM